MKTVQDGYITHYWKNLYDINADIVGSPTINNYIVGGLSDSNYLLTPSTFQPLNNFEILIKITTGSSVTSSSNLSFIGANDNKTCLVIAVESSKFKLYLSSGSSSWNIANGIKGSYTVLPNTVYYVKLLHDENSYTLSYSLDNINFINDIIINNSSNLSQTKLRFGRTYSSGQSFNGSIDFEKSYIKINNDVWWNGLSVVGKTPGTAEDYDYTTTENLYKAVKQVERFYWKRETVEYPSGEVKFESSTAGSYNVDLLAGEYEIICVGGGGGGASNASPGGYGAAGGGGSGGYSNETVTLTAGNYTAIVGAGGSRVRSTNSGNTNTAGNGGNSSFGNVIGYYGSGGTAYMVNSLLMPTNCQGNGGAGGSGSTQNGNSGNGTGTAMEYNTTVSGGASVYGGYGAGGDGCATNPSGSLQNRTKAGGSGYVKVTCYSEEIITSGTAEDYDFYTDEDVYKGVNL